MKAKAIVDYSWAGEMAERAKTVSLGTIHSAAQRRAFKFSLRPEFEILINIFGAYKSAAIVFRVQCLSMCVCLTRLTLLTFVYCAFGMIQLK